MKKANKFSYLITALFAVIVLFISSLWSSGVAVVHAATTPIQTVTAYEQQNVLDDLQNSVIAGEKFSLSDYPFDETSKPQIIQFVEFGYSARVSNQEDYGLYVYVYNPQGLAIDTNTSRSKIQIKIGTANYTPYELEFLNYSNARGYEGLFYKFKISVPDRVLKQALKDLSQDKRVYSISGFTLSVNRQLTEYTVAQTYTYSGFAKGYGVDTMTNSTLICTVDGFDKCLDLQVKHTFYRPQGDYYNGEQSQLNSCYFRVPNKYFDDYGELTKIICEWYEYFTKPILVTEDNYTYNKINALRGADTTNLSDDMYFLFNVFWENAKSSWFSKSGISDWTSNYGYEVGDTYHWGFLWLNGAEVEYDKFDNFAAVFYTGGKDCEDYEIDGNVLKDKLLSNSQYLGGELLNDRYSQYLFEDYVQNGYEYGFNHKEINADDMQDVFWHVTTKDFWQTVFSGKFDVQTIYDSKKAIETISDSDLTGSNSEIAGSLYINENDVQSLKDEHKKAKANDETVVILRYSSTQYMCAPCTSTYCRKADIDGGKTLVKTNCESWGKGNFNAYVAQETVYLDFDIISLWFTSDGVETEIPVVHTPTDIISGLTPPLEEDYHNQKDKSILSIIFAVVAVIILIALIFFAIKYLFPRKTVVQVVEKKKKE